MSSHIDSLLDYMNEPDESPRRANRDDESSMADTSMASLVRKRPSERPLRLFVPGRVCLFGEHSDWAATYRHGKADIPKGRCIVCGTNQGIYADVLPHPSKLIMSAVNHRGEKIGAVEVEMNPQRLFDVAQQGGPFSYVAGVAYQILMKYRVGGMIIMNNLTTLPVGKGLSSSAAVCVLVARAFNRVYDLKLTVHGEMDLAYLGEITTPSECGRMDQCCAFGSRPVCMEFDGDRVDCSEIAVGAPLYLVICDLDAFKDTHVILADLNRCYPTPQNEIHQGVHELLGNINLDITQQCMDAVQQGNPARVGELMLEAQAKFDELAIPACTSQLTAPELHRVLRVPEIAPHVFGGKGVGSQGDGSCQFLCKSADDQDRVVEILMQQEQKPFCLKLVIGGSMRIRVAVIPAAAYGPNLFPASKALSPALFPIVDADKYAKPAILILVEEALNAGIEEVYIIVSEHERELVDAFFHESMTAEQLESLPPRLQAYHASILDMGRRVQTIVQREQAGLGHAVFQARKVIQNEHFLLMLGDHLYKSLLEDKSCVQQMISAYNGRNLIGLKSSRIEQAPFYGCVSGRWIIDEPTSADHVKKLDISEVVEKPSIEYARSHLRVMDLEDDKILTIFGLYILNGERICHYLRENIEQNRRQRGSFGLTSVLERVRKEEEFEGFIIQGTRFDIGASASSFVHAAGHFQK